MKKLMMVVVALAVVLPVAAQEHLPAPDRAMEVVTAFLDLSEDQVAVWEGLLDDRAAAAEPVRADLEEAEAELRELLGGEAPDPGEVGILVLEIHGLRGDLDDINHTYIEGFEAMLDEEQGSRLGFIRHADRAQRLLPAFRVFGLLHPMGPGGQEPPPEELPFG